MAKQTPDENTELLMTMATNDQLAARLRDLVAQETEQNLVGLYRCLCEEEFQLSLLENATQNLVRGLAMYALTEILLKQAGAQ